MSNPGTAHEAHPDHALLDDVMTRQDALASLGLKIPDLVEDLIDPAVLTHTALQRSRDIVAQAGLPPSLSRILAAQFMNAFVLGVKFEREGGHRETAEEVEYRTRPDAWKEGHHDGAVGD